MDTAQELISIYHLIRHQEERLHEFRRGVLAILAGLANQPGFLETYRAAVQAIEPNQVTQGHAGTLQSIDDAIQRLKGSVVQ